MRPSFIFVYANPDKKHLFLLKEESRSLNDILHRYQDRKIIEIYREPNATLDSLKKLIDRRAGQIMIFHYAGHAGEESLILEDGKAYADGLATLLGKDLGKAKVVFLNGCSTKAQVAGLLDSGVHAVIATSAPIQDQKAVKFARWFYESLANKKTIKDAFIAAAAAFKMKYRTFDIPEIIRCRSSGTISLNKYSELPWGLFVHKDHGNILDWSFKKIDKPINKKYFGFGFAFIIALFFFWVVPFFQTQIAFNEVKFDDNEEIGILIGSFDPKSIHDKKDEEFIQKKIIFGLKDRLTAPNQIIPISIKEVPEKLKNKFSDVIRAEVQAQKLGARVFIHGFINSSNIGQPSYTIAIDLIEKEGIHLSHMNGLLEMNNHEFEIDSSINDINRFIDFVVGHVMYFDTTPGMMEKSTKHFNASLGFKNSPLNAYPHFYLGNIALFTGSYEHAIEQFEKVIEYNPSLTEAYNNLGVVSSKWKGSTAKAFRYFEQADSIKNCSFLIDNKRVSDAAPNCTNILYNKASMYLEMNQISNAVTDFERMYQCLNQNEESFNSSEIVLFINEYILALIQQYKTTKSASLLDSVFTYQKIVENQLEHLKDESSEQFKQYKAAYLRNSARINIADKKWEEALRLLNESNSLDPENSITRNLIAILKLKMLGLNKRE